MLIIGPLPFQGLSANAQQHLLFELSVDKESKLRKGMAMQSLEIK